MRKESGREDLHHLRQRQYPLVGPSSETTPIAHMLFRPEELHEASGIGSVQIPITKGQRAVGDDAVGIAILDDPVLDLHLDGRTTIETRSIYLNGFAWEEPAHG